MVVKALEKITLTRVDDGTDGKTPCLHIAYADSADGKDGFYVGGGTNLLMGTSNVQDYTVSGSGWATGSQSYNGGSKSIPVTPGASYTYSAIVKSTTYDCYPEIQFFDRDKKWISNSINYPGTGIGVRYASGVAPAGTAFLLVHMVLNNPPHSQTLVFNSEKLELGTVATPWSPAPSEAHPIYMGTYTDYTQADSLDPTAYLWSQIKGDTGKDGVAGKNGVGIKSTQIMYAQSTSGTTAPTTGWTAQVPTLIKGQYLWTQTTWLYTDNTGEAGYTVSYNAKDGNNGSNGIAGKDGVGIRSTTITYATSTSGTSAPTSGWVSTPPAATPGQFIWTRTVWTYTDNTTETGYSVGKIGEKGATGNTGATGANGKSVWSFPYNIGANGAGRWWSDLKPTPTTSNPPKVGDTIIDLIGNMYQITNVVIGGGGGGGTFDYGSLLTSIKGPQGPAGNDITSYASGTVLPTTVAPANSQFWMLNSSGQCTAVYVSDGTKWVATPISASLIVAATFKGMNFEGVTFKGSVFESSNSDGDLVTIKDGQVVTYRKDGTVEYQSVFDTNGITFGNGTMVSSTGIYDESVSVNSLGISVKTDGDAETYQITTDDLVAIANAMSGALLWSGVLYMGASHTVVPSLPLSKCLHGWLLVWGEYTNGAVTGNVNRVTPIWKSQVAANPGRGLTLVLGSFASGTTSSKYVYPANTQIKGNDNNNSDGVVLVAVYAF